jgi:hypothetical protein
MRGSLTRTPNGGTTARGRLSGSAFGAPPLISEREYPIAIERHAMLRHSLHG